MNNNSQPNASYVFGFGEIWQVRYHGQIMANKFNHENVARSFLQNLINAERACLTGQLKTK